MWYALETNGVIIAVKYFTWPPSILDFGLVGNSVFDGYEVYPVRIERV